MKRILLIFPLIISCLLLLAQNKVVTKNFEVKGTCGQCKERIEEAAYKVKGVKSAVWSKKTKILTVVFVDGKTNLQTIQKAIAAIGHDTPDVKATLASYNTLPGCCAYREGKECAH